MGEIVGAALVSHVPPIVMPEADRRAMNNGEDTTLFAGLHQLRAERLDAVGADTIVVFDTHWFTTIEFVVAAHDRRDRPLHLRGTAPRHGVGALRLPRRSRAGPGLGRDQHRPRRHVDHRHRRPVHLPVHYPTINLLPFLQGDERWVSMGVCQTGEARRLPAWWANSWPRPSPSSTGGWCCWPAVG